VLFCVLDWAAAMPNEETAGSLSEKDRMLLMAVPQLGNVAKAFVRVTENKAFKVRMSHSSHKTIHKFENLISLQIKLI